MKIRKILARILLGVLALVAAALAVRAVLNYTEGRKLTSALAELKARGVPLSFKELAGPCPEEQNGATLWKAAEKLYVFKAKDVNAKTFNTFNDTYNDLAGDKPVSAGAWDEIARLIEKNRKFLDLIPEIAARPCFQYADRDKLAFEAKMPDAVKMIRGTRLWGFEALLAAERGDLRASLDRLRTGLRFAPKIAGESTLISYLIALADAKTFLLFLNKCVSGREVGEDLLLPVLGDLETGQIDRWRALLRDCIRGERLFYLDVGRAIQRALGLDHWWERLYFWLIRPLVKRDVRLNLPVYAELESRAPLPYFQTGEYLKSQKDRFNDLPWYSYVSKLGIPNMDSAFMKQATLEALLLTARVGLACRVLKGRTGQYPETLDALVPGLLTEIPIDPFTGKPLVYRRDGEGFIVYSLGSNLKDDGGRSTWMFSRLVMAKDDDWTWKESR
jgi:hypothetical protein